MEIIFPRCSDLFYRRPLIVLCEYIDCLNFSYGVSSLIGEAESHPSLWHDIPVPPRFDNSEHVEIVNNNNNSVIFTINKGIKNQNCKVSSLSMFNQPLSLDRQGKARRKFLIYQRWKCISSLFFSMRYIVKEKK